MDQAAVPNKVKALEFSLECPPRFLRTFPKWALLLWKMQFLFAIKRKKGQATFYGYTSNYAPAAYSAVPPPFHVAWIEAFGLPLSLSQKNYGCCRSSGKISRLADLLAAKPLTVALELHKV